MRKKNAAGQSIAVSVLLMAALFLLPLVVVAPFQRELLPEKHPVLEKEQKPFVQQYVMDQIYNKMIREEAWIAPYYAGDYLQMSVDNENLAFAFPEDGFNVFIDAMCIPKGCQNKEGAEAFINFMCDPEISAANLSYIGYSTPISAAKEYMDEEITSDPVAYLPIETSQLMDSLWLSVKTDGGNTAMYLIIAAVVVVIIVVLAVVMQMQKKKKKARRGGRK